MQEEVENRTLTLVVSGTKFTGRLFKAAISKYMAHRREKKLEKQRGRDSPVTPKGKQTVKQLIGQNQGVSNIEINDPSIKDFERIARKYGVDYAVKKDRSASPPKYRGAKHASFDGSLPSNRIECVRLWRETSARQRHLTAEKTRLDQKLTNMLTC